MIKPPVSTPRSCYMAAWCYKDQITLFLKRKSKLNFAIVFKSKPLFWLYRLNYRYTPYANITGKWCRYFLFTTRLVLYTHRSLLVYSVEKNIRQEIYNSTRCHVKWRNARPKQVLWRTFWVSWNSIFYFSLFDEWP